jgi:hypothetical protein
VVGHGYRDHVDAELLGHREVPVVAGDRAQERGPRPVQPPLRAARQREEQGVDDAVVHQRQAGVAQCQQLARRDLQEAGEDLPQLGQARHAAVVAGVGAVAGAEVAGPRQRQHVPRQVQLLGRRFAAGEVQPEPAGAQAGVVGAQSRQGRQQRGLGSSHVHLLNPKGPAGCARRKPDSAYPDGYRLVLTRRSWS